MAQLFKTLPAMQEAPVRSLVASLVHSTECSAGDLGSIPGLGRSPGEGKGYPLQYSGLKTPTTCVSMGHTKESDTTEQLSLSLGRSWGSGSNQTTAESEEGQDRKTRPLALQGSGCLTQWALLQTPSPRSDSREA